MVLPPPNVTGSLHIGHCLTVTLQDVLARWKRMQGYQVAWIPGLDHAGIATQFVVEKQLMKEKGVSRHDLGRDAFVEQVWKWKEQYGGTINSQQRMMGASLDWSKEVFTMDEQRSEGVVEAFVRLYEAGKIYRSTRMVNWCCHLKTVVSDIEVDTIEVEKATFISLPGRERAVEFGVMYDIAYPVEGSTEEIIVSTTRPETMFGDTGVAVHSTDARYKHLHGKSLVQPLSGRRIPIVVDDELVDPEFGTGAVKVTPGHDPNDFMCGQRLKLEIISIMNEEGKLTSHDAVPKAYHGMDRYDARSKIIQDLDAAGSFRGRNDHSTAVSICSRSGDALEPFVLPQWFVDCQGMGKEALEFVEKGEMTLIPKQFNAVWDRWMSNIQDWCISRQLWWGHRIPAYRVIPASEEDKNACRIGSEGNVAAPTAPSYDAGSDGIWVVARTREEAVDKVVKEHGLSRDGFTLVQDEDVLDTWFSSALFPLSCFGWPREDTSSDVLRQWYPLSLMETGSDILFFWVARMTMLCSFLSGTKAPPFKEVFLHPMVRDSQGRKMSKSLGNVIDPMDVIEGRDLPTLEHRLQTGNLKASEVKRYVSRWWRWMCGVVDYSWILCEFCELDRGSIHDAFAHVHWHLCCLHFAVLYFIV